MHKFLKSPYFLGMLCVLGFVTLRTFFSLHKQNSVPELSVSEMLNNVHITTVTAVPETQPQAVEVVKNHILKSPLSKNSEVKIASKNPKLVEVVTPRFIGPEKVGISWNEFTNLPYTSTNYHTSVEAKDFQPLEPKHKPIMCSTEIEQNLAKPRLSSEDFDWCKWAISPSGGGVIVGKSWGKLNKKEQHAKFDLLNCNSVASGKNPSCDDSWGDIHMKNWLNNPLPKSEFSCLEDGKHKSKQLCYKNDNSDLYCVLENAQINFAKFTKYQRPGTTPSKNFEQNFLSTDCNDKNKEPSFPFPYLYSPQVSKDQCDFVHNGTVLLYSHDDIRNLGHTLNDVFNVWVMLWLAGEAREARSSLNMLNVDSFKLGHNFDDQPNSFFLTYDKSFHSVLKGNDYKDKTVCFQKLLIQPIPPRFFIWESWFQDMPCSFMGPSSLYQRWNYHVRHAYNLISNSHTTNTNNNNVITLPTDEVLKILLIVRNENSNLWGASRTSRNYLNLDEMKKTLKDTVATSSAQFAKQIPKIELVVQDLSKLKFEEQLQLISQSSITIGMHGAGIASSMHMSIGSKFCCGVLEIYPQGEFSPIKGHGNMARKMGLHYDRIDIPSAQSKGDGASVPVSELSTKVVNMIRNIAAKPTCVLRDVYEDPFLERKL